MGAVRQACNEPCQTVSATRLAQARLEPQRSERELSCGPAVAEPMLVMNGSACWLPAQHRRHPRTWQSVQAPRLLVEPRSTAGIAYARSASPRVVGRRAAEDVHGSESNSPARACRRGPRSRVAASYTARPTLPAVAAPANPRRATGSRPVSSASEMRSSGCFSTCSAGARRRCARSGIAEGIRIRVALAAETETAFVRAAERSRHCPAAVRVLHKRRAGWSMST